MSIADMLSYGTTNEI